MNIVITGASSGIGFEAVLEWIQHDGHTVIAIARSKKKLENLRSIALSLNPNCNLEILDFDLVNGDYEQQLVPFVKQRVTGVDVLVNNAGVLINKEFSKTTPGDFSAMFQGNVVSHIRMIQALLPVLNRNSHILNIGSMGGYQGSQKFPGLSAYSASKSALHTLTECLALELSGQQIKVNCLALGSAQTEMLEAAFPNYQSPVMAFEMGKFIADFALGGHKFFNGKIVPVASEHP